MSRIAALAALLLPAAAAAEGPLAARAILRDAKGSTVGTAMLVAEGWLYLHEGNELGLTTAEATTEEEWTDD
jgi:hypothetical protein